MRRISGMHKIKRYTPFYFYEAYLSQRRVTYEPRTEIISIGKTRLTYEINSSSIIIVYEDFRNIVKVRSHEST